MPEDQDIRLWNGNPPLFEKPIVEDSICLLEATDQIDEYVFSGQENQLFLKGGETPDQAYSPSTFKNIHKTKKQIHFAQTLTKEDESIEQLDKHRPVQQYKSKLDLFNITSLDGESEPAMRNMTVDHLNFGNQITQSHIDSSLKPNPEFVSMTTQTSALVKQISVVKLDPADYESKSHVNSGRSGASHVSRMDTLKVPGKPNIFHSPPVENRITFLQSFLEEYKA